MTPPPTPETIDQVISVITLFTGPRRIDPRASLQGDLALDWMDRIELALEIEATFNITVGDLETKDWETVEDVARTVEFLSRSKAA
jgi:acyl carrier protein